MTHSAGIKKSIGTLKSHHHYFQTQVQKFFVVSKFIEGLVQLLPGKIEPSTLRSSHSETWELCLWTWQFLNPQPSEGKHHSFSWQVLTTFPHKHSANTRQDLPVSECLCTCSTARLLTFEEMVIWAKYTDFKDPTCVSFSWFLTLNHSILKCFDSIDLVLWHWQVCSIKL